MVIHILNISGPSKFKSQGFTKKKIFRLEKKDILNN